MNNYRGVRLLVCVCLVGLVFQLAMAESQNPERDTRMVEDFVQRKKQQWREVLGLSAIDDNFCFWLLQVDPRPNRALTPFTDEILIDPYGEFVQESSEWMATFVKDVANPYVNQKKPCKYFLRDEKYGRSLLVYEWTSEQYRFEVVESCAGVLVRINTIKSPLAPQEGIERRRVAAILEDVLKLPNSNKYGRTAGQFHLLPMLVTGQVATNMKQVIAGPISDWHDHIVCFLSDRDLCVLFFKAHFFRANCNLPDDEFWLPAHLYDKDGKNPVFRGEKLHTK